MVSGAERASSDTYLFSALVNPRLRTSVPLLHSLFCKSMKGYPTKTKRYEAETCLFQQTLVYLSRARASGDRVRGLASEDT